jgi:hypothetical protein
VQRNAEREDHHRAFLTLGRDSIGGSCEIHSNPALN